MTETVDLGACLVTGGGGFFGQHLVSALLDRGGFVRAFDLSAPAIEHERLEFIQGDIRDETAVDRACEGIDTVFHTVAMLDFRTFAPPAAHELSRAVNVGGVENIVRSARAAGVQRLIHTSSNNVTFHEPVVDGDETWPYATAARDLYTLTKIAGEKAALAANDPDGLLTCAIRPGGIWGPDDKLMIPTVVENCMKGRMVVIVGDGQAKSDNTLVDNLVDGEIEAARHLTPESPLGGQAYFITDDDPVNYFDFFRPLIEALGLPFPTRHIPGALLTIAAFFGELAHRYLGAPRPAMTILETRKLLVTHYSRIDKARRDFGWEPKFSVAEGQRRCCEVAREMAANFEKVDRPAWYWGVLPLGLVLLGLLVISPDAYAAWSASITTWTPRWLLGGVFVWACWFHVQMALQAVQIAEHAGLSKTATGWGWQTFWIGTPSLNKLRERVTIPTD